MDVPIKFMYLYRSRENNVQNFKNICSYYKMGIQTDEQTIFLDQNCLPEVKTVSDVDNRRLFLIDYQKFITV